MNHDDQLEESKGNQLSQRRKENVSFVEFRARPC